MPPIKKKKKTIEATFNKGTHPDAVGLKALQDIIKDTTDLEKLDFLSAGQYDNGEKFITVEVRYTED